MTLRGARQLPSSHELAIEDLNSDGQGVGRLDGRVVFVPGALPGEFVTIRTAARRRRFKRAELLAVQQASPDRVEPACEYFGRCGGCSLQHLSAEGQRAHKQSSLAAALTRLGGVQPREWSPPIVGPQLGYRRRARLGARWVAKKGQVLLGFRERNGRFVMDMGRCPVLEPALSELIAPLRSLLTSLTVKDRVPQVEMARGDGATVLLIRSLDPPTVEDEANLVRFGDEHGVDIWLQLGGPQAVRILTAKSSQGSPLSYRLEDFDITLGFAPNQFVQVNRRVNEQMVHQAVTWLAPGPQDRILDLFCGLGNFTLALGASGATVLGLEGAADLVSQGESNAALNGLANVRFEQADLYRENVTLPAEEFDLVVLDPPRSGALALLPEISRVSPRRLLYVSCHPGTLARDAGELVRAGFSLERAGLVDLFPQTHHAEAMALFSGPGG